MKKAFSILLFVTCAHGALGQSQSVQSIVCDGGSLDDEIFVKVDDPTGISSVTYDLFDADADTLEWSVTRDPDYEVSGLDCNLIIETSDQSSLDQVAYPEAVMYELRITTYLTEGPSIRSLFFYYCAAGPSSFYCPYGNGSLQSVPPMVSLSGRAMSKFPTQKSTTTRMVSTGTSLTIRHRTASLL